MGWVVLAVAVAVLLLVVSFKVWRRWIEPWREVDELLEAINHGRTPDKFLMTANIRSRPIGLSLEKLAQRLRDAESAAREGTLNVQTIVGALPDGLVVVDEKHRLQMMNAEFRRLFSLPEGEGVGVALLEILRDAMIDRSLGVALRERAPRRESLSLRRSDARLELEVSIVPFRDETRGTAGAVLLFRDVTQIRRVEEMRRDFVANVSHELRTPLSIFRGYLETLLDDPKQPTDELVRILEVMERHSDRLTTLVDDVLSLARLEAPESALDPVEIDLHDFLPAVMRDWEKRFADKQLRAELEFAADVPVLQADEGRLQEVIYNLLDNAVKHSHPGGPITVRAVPEGGAVRLSVSDEGAGIPAHDLPRIFERFYRADKARSRAVGGTGLGLSIVKHIAQLHGGRVEAESELGRGTTVSVILPTAGPAAQAENGRDVTES